MWTSDVVGFVIEEILAYFIFDLFLELKFCTVIMQKKQFLRDCDFRHIVGVVNFKTLPLFVLVHPFNITRHSQQLTFGAHVVSWSSISTPKMESITFTLFYFLLLFLHNLRFGFLFSHYYAVVFPIDFLYHWIFFLLTDLFLVGFT